MDRKTPGLGNLCDLSNEKLEQLYKQRTTEIISIQKQLLSTLKTSCNNSDSYIKPRIESAEEFVQSVRLHVQQILLRLENNVSVEILQEKVEDYMCIEYELKRRAKTLIESLTIDNIDLTNISQIEKLVRRSVSHNALAQSFNPEKLRQINDMTRLSNLVDYLGMKLVNTLSYRSITTYKQLRDAYERRVSSGGTYQLTDVGKTGWMKIQNLIEAREALSRK